MAKQTTKKINTTTPTPTAFASLLGGITVDLKDKEPLDFHLEAEYDESSESASDESSESASDESSSSSGEYVIKPGSENGIVIDIDEDSSEDSDSKAEQVYVIFLYLEPNGEVKQFAKAGPYDYGTAYTEIEVPNGFPQRNIGYWAFSGWSVDFEHSSETLTSSISVFAKYEPFKRNITVQWNQPGVFNTTVECTWGEIYPSLDKPSTIAADKIYYGAYLATTDNRILTRTHSAEGVGVTNVSSRELAPITVDARNGTPQPSDEPNCNINVLWSSPIEWNTQEDLRNAVGAIPTPFSAQDYTLVQIPAEQPDDDTDSDTVSFKDGFPSAYTVPIIDPTTGEVNQNARVVSRRMMNTLGYIGTQEQFFEQCGGYHTFNQQICDAIGGYPKTAILRFLDENGNLRTVYSLLDDNTWDFTVNGVDGIHWKYIDDNPILSLKIDYSDFIDLSNILFVETGQPDFYEAPYDGYLQMYALSHNFMQSTERALDDQWLRAAVGATNNNVVYENVQAALWTLLYGTSYLDVYNVQTNTTNSIKINISNSANFGASYQSTGQPGEGLFYIYKLPLYNTSQLNVFINKGDQIRIRSSYKDTNPLAGGSLFDPSHIYDMTFTDKEMQRRYLCKFANFYRIGWEG